MRWLPLIGIGLMFFGSGCGDEKSSQPQGKKSTGGSPAAAQTQTENPCESTLATIDEVFSLSRLERTTTVSDGVLRLNDWQRACGAADVSTALTPEIEKLLSESQLKFLAEKRFLLHDGEHIRDCLLDRAVAGYAAGTGATELDRVTHLFGHVVRAIGLVPTPPENLPLSRYEVYLFGKGTAKDRAWIFVSALKQLRIDAVVLLPQRANGQTPAAPDRPFLVGVLLEGQVYLFDPHSGVPIPALPGGDAVSRPATLAEAAADPAVLAQLDVGAERPYPISADDLRQPDVAIAEDTAFWSARMQDLQTQFVAARAMVIADLLSDTPDGGPGLLSRVAKAGGEFWDASRIRVWTVPEERMTGRAQMTKDQLDVLSGLLSPFGAYKTMRMDENGQPVPVDQELHEDRAGDKDLHPEVRVIQRTTTGAQMQARIDQLEGKFAQAVRKYLEVREKCRELLRFNVSILERIRHARAIEDATYWTALCQYEQGEYKSAVNTLLHYRKRTDSKNWLRESRYLLALSQAAAGDYKAAISELEAAGPDDPEWAGYRQLIQRWQAAAKPKVDPAA